MITIEDFVRAIIHGWNNCEIYYHMDVRRAYEALAEGFECRRQDCECGNAKYVTGLIEMTKNYT